MSENDDILQFVTGVPEEPDYAENYASEAETIPSPAEYPEPQAEPDESETSEPETAADKPPEEIPEEFDESNMLILGMPQEVEQENANDSAVSSGQNSDQESLKSDAYEDNENLSQTAKILDTAPSVKKNEAPKLKRGKILITISGIFIFTIVFFTCILPMFTIKKKNKSTETEKAGKIYIPGIVDNIAENQSTKDISSGVSGNSSGIDYYESGTSADLPQTQQDLASKYPSPLDEPAHQAPVSVPKKSGSSTGEVIETNRNEQQKQLQRLRLEDFGSSINGSSKSGSSYATSVPSGYENYSTQSPYSQSAYTPRSLAGNMEAYSPYAAANSSSYNSQNNQTNKEQFLQRNMGGSGNYQWNNEYTIWKGTIISAVLDTGINTDLPGELMGHITRNVYSSMNGNYLLIPQGSRLIGEYNSTVSYGQNRVQIVWNTLIRPDGLEINLGSMTGIDEYGRAGQKGFKNEHPFEYAKAFGLIAAYSILDTKLGNVTSNNEYAQNVMTDVYGETKRLNNEIVSRAMDIQPTITVKPGTEVNLITNVTIDLPPVDKPEVTEKYKR